MSGEDLRILGATNSIQQNRVIDSEKNKLAEKEKAAMELLNQIAGKKVIKNQCQQMTSKKNLKKI